jgi:DTW domain-containing protein YfiP
MARAVCRKCHRPEKVCICDFISPVENRVEIGILQHPTEAKQIKGTAILAALSLQKAKLWVSESVEEVSDLLAWLNNHKQTYLLYPPTEEQNSSTQVHRTEQLKAIPAEDYQVLVLDGTWRKTFKMLQLNQQLADLSRVVLEPETESKYIVRKQKDQNSLSTVEAVAELLSRLESDAEKFQPLLQAFESMQQQQMAFRKK